MISNVLIITFFLLKFLKTYQLEYLSRLYLTVLVSSLYPEYVD